MKRNFRRSFAVLAIAGAAAGSLLVGLAGTASAAGSPPWEPLGSPEVGSLTFYNAAGQQITGGNLTDAPLAAYIEGSTVLRAGDTSATLYGATPVNGIAAGQWSGEQISGSPAYPNASAPAPLNTSSLPVVTGAPSDESLATYIGDFPNSDTSTTDGYAGLYVLRLFTGAAGKSTTTTYDAADIQLSNVVTTDGVVTGGTWSAVYPTPSLTGTSTSLTTNPPTTAASGALVTLNATVAPSAPGTVQFEEGGNDIGTPQTVTGGAASIQTSSLPVGSADALSAVFTPAQFSAYSGSTGTATIDVTPPPATSTVTALSVEPTSSVADTAVVITADVSNANTSAALNPGDGQVAFYDDGTDTGGDISGSSALLGTEPLAAGGIATLSYGSFAVGAHNLVAEFEPANTAVYNSSLSSGTADSVGPVLYTATAPLWTPDPQTVTVGIPAGSLVISTPYGPSNPFSLGTASLDGDGLAFHASAAFGTPATDAISSTTGLASAGGVLITDTRAGDTGWTASAEVTNFSGPGSDQISGENLEFTGVTASYISGNALQSPDVTTAPVNSSAVSSGTPFGSGASGTNGLAGEPHPFAYAGTAAPGYTSPTSPTQTDGSVWVNGLVTLVAPTSTPAGTYTATLTFTIA
jgi:hypothetical protein